MTEKEWQVFIKGMKAMAKEKLNVNDDGLADRLHISVSKIRKGMYTEWEFAEVLRLARLAGVGIVPEFVR